MTDEIVPATPVHDVTRATLQDGTLLFLIGKLESWVLAHPTEIVLDITIIEETCQGIWFAYVYYFKL